MPPPRVDGRADRPGQLGLVHLVRHVGAVPRHLPPHQRVGTGSDRLGVGRQIDACRVRAHLVVIDVRLRDPLAEHDLGPVLRLDRVLHEGVAVVVVPDVVVVELGRPRALVLGADPAIVPLGDDVRTVRVEARNDDGDRILEDLGHRAVGPGREVVHDLRGTLRPRDFGRVEAIRLHEDHLAVSHGFVDFGLRAATWVLKRPIQALDLVDSLEVGG